MEQSPLIVRSLDEEDLGPSNAWVLVLIMFMLLVSFALTINVPRTGYFA